MYQALYRKWRPMSFGDVVSQPHITTTLKNQIKGGKTAHAYLFTGSRGTGKTTCARIFAKAINCLDPKDGEPCLECDICKMADSGTLADIIEIDAASNSKVEDIRELREGVVYTPEICKYKVYIIDEVHMLSAGAFNALLKTMEEPPPHVKFVLATTEIQKVPATIVSRCQHFDFHRIRSEDIVSRLMYIAGQENFTLTEEAAELVARLSDGGMRDALSLLDQCAAFGDNVDVNVVSQAAGIAGRDYLFDILESIAAGDTAQALRTVDSLYSMSKDLKVLAGELLTQMRNVMIAKTIDNSRELITCLPEEFDRIKALAEKMKLDDILENISVLQQTSERFARAASKRIELEMMLVRLCSPKREQKGVSAVSGAEVSAIEARLDRIERAQAVGITAPNPMPQAMQAAPAPQPEQRQEQRSAPSQGGGKLSMKDFSPVAGWDDIVAQVNEKYPATGCFLKGSSAFSHQNILLLTVNNEFFKEKFKKGRDAALLNEILKANFGQTFNIKVRSASNGDVRAESPLSALVDKAKAMNIEVEIKNK
ncbi:MAG: DNA polymerase III subunit gamma/tau [Ruminococcus sp.]|nr:DNA polymerase III subunit gamma/tau [Ruminococcus sp.]